MLDTQGLGEGGGVLGTQGMREGAGVLGTEGSAAHVRPFMIQTPPFLSLLQRSLLRPPLGLTTILRYMRMRVLCARVQSLTIAKDSVIRIKILNVTIQSKKIVRRGLLCIGAAAHALLTVSCTGARILAGAHSLWSQRCAATISVRVPASLRTWPTPS